MYEKDIPLPTSQSAGLFPEASVGLEQNKHVLIIGAGISGLASAWFIQQLFKNMDACGSVAPILLSIIAQPWPS